MAARQTLKPASKGLWEKFPRWRGLAAAEFLNHRSVITIGAVQLPGGFLSLSLSFSLKLSYGIANETVRGCCFSMFSMLIHHILMKQTEYASLQESVLFLWISPRFQAKAIIRNPHELQKYVPHLEQGFIENFRRALTKGQTMSVRLTPYVVTLIDWSFPEACPVRKQYIPLLFEHGEDHPYVLGLPHGTTADRTQDEADYSPTQKKILRDSLHETEYSAVEGLVHKYPDKVLFLANDICPVYCRYEKYIHLIPSTHISTLLSIVTFVMIIPLFFFFGPPPTFLQILYSRLRGRTESSAEQTPETISRRFVQFQPTFCFSGC